MARWTREERVLDTPLGTLTVVDIVKAITKFPEMPSHAEIDRAYDDKGEREWSVSWLRLMTAAEEAEYEAEEARKQQAIDEAEAEDRRAGF